MNKHHFAHKKGFTLLELMIVVGLVAILSTLAYGSYIDAVRKSNRGDAQAALTAFASAMERFYTEQTPSTYIGAKGNNNFPIASVFPKKAPLDGAKKHYNLKIQNVSATSYELRAIPIGSSPQKKDKCGTLTLKSDGKRGVSGADQGVGWKDCWR